MSKRNLLLTSAALLIVAGGAYAQNAKFNVPFQFTVYNTVMPAGSYFIKSETTNSSALIIKNGQQGRSRIFYTVGSVQSLGRQGQTKVVFDCYNGSCYLSQVWSGSTFGRQLIKSRQELEMAKQHPAVHSPVVAAVR